MSPCEKKIVNVKTSLEPTRGHVTDERESAKDLVVRVYVQEKGAARIEAQEIRC